MRLAAENNGPSCFFDGYLKHPMTSATCLRAVSDIVGTRFYVPAAMLARILREADPVATVAKDMVRFEGFSGCCSTYIRLDIDASGFLAEAATPGTVNVDFRDDMRAALGQVRRDSQLRLTISTDTVRVEHQGKGVVEKKVPLPLRWVKGLAEVQTHQASMLHSIRLSKIAAQRFLRSLPRAASNQPQWVVASGGSVRLSARETPASVRIIGTQRLRKLERLASVAEQLDVYFNEAQGSSAWVLRFEAQRLTLVLNSEPWRGFSGDGQLLSDLAPKSDQGASKIRANLHWQSTLQPDVLAKDCGLTTAQTNGALARLAASGLLGFDLASGTYFHRVLPFDLEKIEQLNPRLVSARALAASGAVTLLPDGGAEVRSGDVVHRVRRTSEQTSCTCPWFAKHQATRGPCKHVLATEVVAEESYE